MDRVLPRRLSKDRYAFALDFSRCCSCGPENTSCARTRSTPKAWCACSTMSSAPATRANSASSGRPHRLQYGRLAPRRAGASCSLPRRPDDESESPNAMTAQTDATATPHPGRLAGRCRAVRSYPEDCGNVAAQQHGAAVSGPDHSLRYRGASPRYEEMYQVVRGGPRALSPAVGPLRARSGCGAMSAIATSFRWCGNPSSASCRATRRAGRASASRATRAHERRGVRRRSPENSLRAATCNAGSSAAPRTATTHCGWRGSTSICWAPWR